MITVPLARASRSLAEYATELHGGVVVVTKGRRAVAALVSLQDVDDEAHGLGANPRFLELIDEARRQFATGRSRSLAQVRSSTTPKTPRKRSRRPVSRRRARLR